MVSQSRDILLRRISADDICCAMGVTAERHSKAYSSCLPILVAPDWQEHFERCVDFVKDFVFFLFCWSDRWI